MDAIRHKRIEDKAYDLLEAMIDKLKARIDSGEAAAADFQAATALLKHLDIDLEVTSGPDPVLPSEDDLPFTESDHVSLA